MLEDAAPDAPERPWLPDFGSLLRLGTRPSGSMLLHDIATAEGQQARGGGRPRGWLQAAAPAAGDPTNQGGSGPSTGPAPGATPSSTPSSSGPFGSPSPSPSSSGPGDSPANPRSSGPSSALSGLIEALKDAGRLVGDPAFAEVGQGMRGIGVYGSGKKQAAEGGGVAGSLHEVRELRQQSARPPPTPRCPFRPFSWEACRRPSPQVPAYYDCWPDPVA